MAWRMENQFLNEPPFSHWVELSQSYTKHLDISHIFLEALLCCTILYFFVIALLLCCLADSHAKILLIWLQCVYKIFLCWVKQIPALFCFLLFVVYLVVLEHLFLHRNFFIFSSISEKMHLPHKTAVTNWQITKFIY